MEGVSFLEQKEIKQNSVFIASRVVGTAISVILAPVLLDPFHYVEKAKQKKQKYNRGK